MLMSNSAAVVKRKWEVWACPSLSENHHLYAGNEGATPSTSFTQTVAMRMFIARVGGAPEISEAM